MSQSFVYQPIVQENEIRVLEVLQQASLPRCFRLVHIPLDDSEEMLRYIALSYCWGESLETRTIFVDGAPFKVSVDLSLALDDILGRGISIGNHVWVDQVCINQTDKAEQSKQVRLMGDVYQKATAVYIWLGLPGEDHEHAVDVLSHWSSCIGRVQVTRGQPLLATLRAVLRDQATWNALGFPSLSERTWLAVYRLCSRPWWRRAWVVQEATGRAPTYAICGRSCIVFQELLEAFIATQPVARLSGYPYPPLDTRYLYRMLMILELRMERQLQLLDGLQFLRYFSCKDPRDKVYAILCALEDGKKNIQPDYTKSVQAVYKDVVRVCLCNGPPLHCLDFLAYVAGQSHTRDDWPSFVPDWSESLDFDNFKKYVQEYRDGNRVYRSSLDFDGCTSLVENQLHVDAFAVDSVREVKSMCADRSQLATVVEEWRPEQPEHMYMTGTVTNQQAYLHTLVGVVLRTDAFTVERGLSFDVAALSVKFDSGTSVDVVQDAHRMRVSMACSVVSRRFFWTSKGYMGIGPATLQVGDRICGFLGGQMLYGIRKHPQATSASYFTFLGECYVHGLMDGEALQCGKDGSPDTFRIALI